MRKLHPANYGTLRKDLLNQIKADPSECLSKATQLIDYFIEQYAHADYEFFLSNMISEKKLPHVIPLFMSLEKSNKRFTLISHAFAKDKTNYCIVYNALIERLNYNDTALYIIINYLTATKNTLRKLVLSLEDPTPSNAAKLPVLLAAFFSIYKTTPLSYIKKCPQWQRSTALAFVN